MYPPRILGLLLAASTAARATNLADRIPQIVAKALDARTGNAAPTSTDNILSDVLNTSKAATDKTADTPTPTTKKTSDNTTPTEEPTTAKPTSTEKTDAEPTQTTDNNNNNNNNSQNTDSTPSAPTTPSTPTQTGSGDGDNTTAATDNQTTPPPSNGNGDAQSSVVVETMTTIITTTNAAGQQVAFTTTTRTTSTPGLSNSGSGDTSQGMSSSTRNTVIGVVVGVGGAIILGALGFVFWRIRNRRRATEESDHLMGYDPALQHSGMEKGDTASVSIGGSVRNPFQSTLDNYHRPTQVNPSANF